MYRLALVAVLVVAVCGQDLTSPPPEDYNGFRSRRPPRPFWGGEGTDRPPRGQGQGGRNRPPPPPPGFTPRPFMWNRNFTGPDGQIMTMPPFPYPMGGSDAQFSRPPHPGRGQGRGRGRGKDDDNDEDDSMEGSTPQYGQQGGRRRKPRPESTDRPGKNRPWSRAPQEWRGRQTTTTTELPMTDDY